jgi:nucleotide-binding universal stress UspA family protein
MALRTILLPFDGSEPARAALSHVRLLAGQDSAVHLVYVLPSYDLLARLGASQDAARDASAMLSAAAEGLACPTRCTLLSGDPAEAVAAEADRLSVDLVVLGSRGRSAVAGLLLGSTTRKLLSVSTRPVLVAHKEVGAIHTIVVGVEEGPNGARLAAQAAMVAGRTGARVALVNVVDADPQLAARPERFGIPADQWREALAQHAERAFAPLRTVLPGADEQVRYGGAARELRAVADSEGAEVVIVARRGRSGRDVDAWFSVAFTLAVRGPFATIVA